MAAEQPVWISLQLSRVIAWIEAFLLACGIHRAVRYALVCTAADPHHVAVLGRVRGAWRLPAVRKTVSPRKLRVALAEGQQMLHVYPERIYMGLR